MFVMMQPWNNTVQHKILVGYNVGELIYKDAGKENHGKIVTVNTYRKTKYW